MVQGRAYYAVNPEEEANRGITDLGLAPRNKDGWVEFSGDFVILRPKDPAKTKKTIFVEIPNRGTTQMYVGFFRLTPNQTFDLLNLKEVETLEDAFIFEQGFTIVWIGWQFDISAKTDVKLNVPTVEVLGERRWDYIPQSDTVTQDFPLFSGESELCAIDTNRAELTIRDSLDGPPIIVPRNRWAFARLDSGKIVPDPCYLRISEPILPGKLYELIYRVRGSRVAGLGFAAVEIL